MLCCSSSPSPSSLVLEATGCLHLFPQLEAEFQLIPAKIWWTGFSARLPVRVGWGTHILLKKSKKASAGPESPPSSQVSHQFRESEHLIDRKMNGFAMWSVGPWVPWKAGDYYSLCLGFMDCSVLFLGISVFSHHGWDTEGYSIVSFLQCKTI